MLDVGLSVMRDVVGLVELEDEWDAEDELGDEVFVLERVGVGVGLGVVVGLGDDSEDPGEPDPEFELPAWKTTMLAVSPWGTVTTQKLAPPAPVD
jgi:hypothetical protein